MRVYFGFTSCPDVCPTDHARISAALEALGPDADRIAPLFVTLDPARDTVRALGQYVEAFDRRIVALTGPADAVARMAEAYRVYWSREPIAGALGYTIDHSAYLYLVDPSGRYAGFLPPSSPASRIQAVLRDRLAARVQ